MRFKKDLLEVLQFVVGTLVICAGILAYSHTLPHPSQSSTRLDQAKAESAQKAELPLPAPQLMTKARVEVSYSITAADTVVASKLNSKIQSIFARPAPRTLGACLDDGHRIATDVAPLYVLAVNHGLSHTNTI